MDQSRKAEKYLLEKYGGQSEALSLGEFLILCVAEDPENLRISGSDTVPPYMSERRTEVLGTHFLNPTATTDLGALL